MNNGPTSIEHFWLMHMLRKFGAKQNLYFIFSAPSLSKHRFRAIKGVLIFIDATNKFSNFQKKNGILLAT